MRRRAAISMLPTMIKLTRASRPARRHRAAQPAALAVALSGVLATVAVATALAATGIGRETTFHARFTTRNTASATGLALHTTGQPPQAGVTEPPAVRQTVILPKGTSLRLGALPQCTAGDALIGAEGAEVACPASSRVGTGGADGILSGAAVHFDLGIYAVRGHLVFAAERGGQPLKQFFAGVARGNTLLLTVPTLGGQIAPTGFSARIAAKPRGKAWLRTPASCPRSGHWTAVGHVQGVSSADPSAHVVTPAQTLADRLPCR